MTQGGRANTQGKILESTIIPTFERHGFQVVKYSDWSKNPDLYERKLLLKNVPYTTIYGHKGYTEFLAIGETKYLPTEQQKDAAIFVCQLLSNLYQPISLFQYDNRLKKIYILAGINDGLQILIKDDGNWDFEI
jgi:hypothetical protein